MDEKVAVAVAAAAAAATAAEEIEKQPGRAVPKRSARLPAAALVGVPAPLPAAYALRSPALGGRQCIEQSAGPESLLRGSCREEDEDFSWSYKPRTQVLHEGLIETRTRLSKMTKYVVPVVPPHSSEGDGQTFPQSFKVKGS